MSHAGAEATSPPWEDISNNTDEFVEANARLPHGLLADPKLMKPREVLELYQFIFDYQANHGGKPPFTFKLRHVETTRSAGVDGTPSLRENEDESTNGDEVALVPAKIASSSSTSWRRVNEEESDDDKDIIIDANGGTLLRYDL